MAISYAMRPRKSRLTHFEERAEAFARDRKTLERGRKKEHPDLSVVVRQKPLLVGAQRNRRLISRMDRGHTFNRLEEVVSKLSIKSTQKFVLVPIASSRKFEVQEYFNKPSVQEAAEFLNLRGERSAQKVPVSKSKLSKDQYLICKRFFGQNKGISKEDIQSAWAELVGLFSGIVQRADLKIPKTHVFILGKNEDGRLRFSIGSVDKLIGYRTFIPPRKSSAVSP